MKDKTCGMHSGMEVRQVAEPSVHASMCIEYGKEWTMCLQKVSDQRDQSAHRQHYEAEESLLDHLGGIPGRAAGSDTSGEKAMNER